MTYPHVYNVRVHAGWREEEGIEPGMYVPRDNRRVVERCDPSILPLNAPP